MFHPEHQPLENEKLPQIVLMSDLPDRESRHYHLQHKYDHQEPFLTNCDHNFQL